MGVEETALMQALRIGGELTAILFLVIYFCQKVLAKTRLLSARDSSRVISQMLVMVGLLAVICVAAYVALQIQSAAGEKEASHAQVRSSVDAPPPLVIDKSITVQTGPTPDFIDKLEKMAVTIYQQDQGLALERSVSASMDAELALHQVDQVRQNYESTWAVLYDLARLRTWKFSEAQFVERWKLLLSSTDLAQHLSVLERLRLIDRTNGTIAISARAAVAVQNRGYMPESIVAQQGAPEWCARATRPVDVAICGSASLVNDELRVMQLYQQDRAQRGAPAVQAQTAWRSGTRDPCGSSEECLHAAYQQRLMELQQQM